MVQRLIRDFCIKNTLLEEGDKVLLGLSGGADSVCLLFALLEMQKEYKLTISAVHVNHGIRGSEADRDEEFCRKLCLSYGVDFIARHINVPDLAAETGDSLEEAGRKARYQLFNSIAEDKGYNKIAVAHHKNDQAETVLFQMVRGSRITGLAGIKPKNGNIIRPLLCLEKKEILEYLNQNGYDFVTDSTNLENDASRNVLRNEVMPRLLDIQPGAIEHICDVADYMRRVDDYLEKEAGKLYDTAVRCEADRTIVSIKDLREADSLLAERVLYMVLCSMSGRKKDITHRHVESALALMDMQTGAKQDFKYGISGQKAFVSLIFTGKNKFDIDDTNSDNTSHAKPCFSTELVARTNGESTSDFIKRAGGFGEQGRRKLLDMEAVKGAYPDFFKDGIICRQARPTDYIAVYKDGRKKKVFDLLMESKIPTGDRSSCQVVAFEDEVFVIQGMRGCEAYRVTDETREILVINI